MRQQLSTKQRRCFQRVVSGLEPRGHLRFLTLTSSPQSPDSIHHSFRVLMWRLKRRGLVKGYIQCTEVCESGLKHKHMIFRGRYIEQALISKWWQDIHKAYIVDIRQVKQLSDKRDMAMYLAKYMAKQDVRYSWDWGWLWRGFAGDWQNLKKWGRLIRESGHPCPMNSLIKLWKLMCGSLSPPPKRWQSDALKYKPLLMLHELNHAYLRLAA